MFYKCKRCGCSLDPGERCDCQDSKNKYIALIEHVLSEDKDGQITLGGIVLNESKTYNRTD